ASENTEKASDNTDVSDLLDFSTTALTYTANNISGTVTAGDLSGTLDARFYGDAAREFGGTFALTNATSYYYGAFGAEHGGINTLTFTASTIAEEILNVADRTPGMPFGLSTDTLKDSKANHDMNSLAVYQDDTNAYSRVLNRSWGTADNAQTTEIVRVTNSLGRVQFDNITGNIKEISVYLSGVNYSTIVPSSSSSVKLSATDINRRNGMLLDNVINSDFDATIATLEADRSSGFFGFDTEYMAYIGWHIAQKESDLSTNSTVLTDSIYNKNGMMLAGIETTATDLNAISVNDTTFTGKGSGIYGDANESYKTIFSVIATINFGARNITIKSHDTCKASSCGVKLNSLNFSTSALSFEDPDDATASVNLISGAINTTDTDNNLAGTLDARFYGSSAGEFGGSFALVDTSRYYYGVFGAGRSTTINASIDPIAIIADSKLTTAKETDPALNSTYPTITAGAVAGADYTLKGLGIYGKVTNDHTRIAGDSWTYAVVTRETTITKLSDTRVELTHDDTNGTITNMKVILDDDEGSYNSDTVATPNAYKLTASITSPPADATSTKIDGYRGNKFFGFDSNHMVYSHWNLTRADSALHASNTTDTTYATDGVMIAGLETANGDIPITGSVEFIGKGHGFYSNSDTNTDYQTSFRVKANVTFGESKGSITISSRDTCKIIVNADCTDNGADRVNALNFSTEALNFANINNITGTVTAGDLTGTLDARFYGIGTHAAEEFGGAFAMQNTDESYYGAFGAIEKEFHVFADTATFPKWSDTTTRTMNGLGYTIASDKPLTQTFEITQAHDVNSPNAPKRISAVKINTLDIDGLASNTQNFDQKTSNDYFVMIDDVSPSPRVGDFGNPDYSIRFIHKGTTHNTNRITIVHRPNSGEPWSWNYQTVGIIDDGTAKGGFSTGAFTNDIPTNGNSNFEGYVFGYYKNGDDGYLTRATATVAVDFAEGTANITTSATKRITPPTIEASGNGTAVGGSSFKNASTDNSLNFTGTLRYQELYKWFRGDVSTTDGTTLTSGDATMKAYGPNAEEVGGVFRLQNSDGTKTYAGAFGAK
ncbi:MAG: transferrin-binding protein-like solute binding protein, partial [Alphaproteobacteria bacterium]|nr:transferrin-binding protein-like solute binding protein [Alphaproteobacteria bacterium]